MLQLQSSRAKEQLESVGEERDKLSADCQRALEAQRRFERQARDAKDEYDDVDRKLGEASHKKLQLEKKLESLEDQLDQSQSDLRLAFKRIQDLQSAIEDNIATDSDDRCA